MARSLLRLILLGLLAAAAVGCSAFGDHDDFEDDYEYECDRRPTGAGR